MKIRKKYSITVLSFRGVAVLTRKNHWYPNWMKRNATCGCEIYDCTFRETVDNLKVLKRNNFYIYKRK